MNLIDTASSKFAKTGSVTLAYQTDGTGSNGNCGLSAIGAGGSANIAVGLNTASAGVFSQNGSVAFVSQNPEMADVSAGSNAPVLVTAQVNNYANASYSLVSSLGALTHVGTDWVLNLGNDVTGLADVLGGGFGGRCAGSASSHNGALKC